MRRPPRDENGNEVQAPEKVNVDLSRRRRADGDTDEVVRQVRDYGLITPLYGGGVEPAHADPLTTVRATSVRGHLRFWWRACRAARYRTADEMKAAEDALWGSTEAPSAVNVALIPDAQAKPRGEVAFWMERRPRQPDRFDVKNSEEVHPYAAFPLLPDKDERKKSEWKSEEVMLGVRFTLEVSHPRAMPVAGRHVALDVSAEVAAALWAWETFGGLGARTRRGFGALRLLRRDGEEVRPPSHDGLQGDIEKKLAAHVVEGTGSAGVPRLSRQASFRLTAPTQDPVDVWKRLISKLKEFRQYRKKNGRLDPKGASQWPEPHAIRSMARGEVAEVNKFPRGDFGLPIIFELPQARLNATLKGLSADEKVIERLASPLILRPVACAEGAAGLALILEAPRMPPGGLVLTGLGRERRVSSELTGDEARHVSRRLDMNNVMTDVLWAFLETLKEEESNRP